MKKYRCWHFINENRTLGYDAADLTVEPGYIYSIEDDRSPVLCDYGMHGSVRPIDALKYAPGPIACWVDVWGDVVVGDDKLVGRHREVVAVVDATSICHRFGCWCVRHTPIGDGRVAWDLLTDPRSRAAVETKERWLRGEATDNELAAARDAARAAQNTQLEKMLRKALREQRRAS